MRFFGKNIPTDKINFVMNCVSFLLGIIFFIRMQYKLSEQPAQINFNAEHDSLIKIETRVNTELKEIRKVQDSVGVLIQKNRIGLTQSVKATNSTRKQINLTIRNDWENLSKEDQDAYTNNLMSNLKQKQK